MRAGWCLATNKGGHYLEMKSPEIGRQVPGDSPRKKATWNLESNLVEPPAPSISLWFLPPERGLHPRPGRMAIVHMKADTCSVTLGKCLPLSKPQAPWLLCMQAVTLHYSVRVSINDAFIGQSFWYPPQNMRST